MEFQLTSIESVLIICSCIVCYLNATSSLTWVLKQVDIRALIKTMMTRLYFWRPIEVMNICKAIMRLVDFIQLIMSLKLNLRCSYNLLSRLYRHVVGLNGLKDGQRLDSRWKQQREVQETLVATKSRKMRREKLGAKLGSLRQLGFCTM